MEEYEYKKFLELLNKHDKEEYINIMVRDPQKSSVEKCKKELYSYFNTVEDENISVIGIDIYKYSKYDYNEQKIVPILFKILIQKTITDCIKLESIFSIFYDEKYFEDYYIDTGDGCFIFLQNPLDAIVFLTYFSANLHSYNSFHCYPILRKILGSLTIRYALTFDKVYKIDKKFYGPGIINNSRIMSNDKLNRFIIDGNSWEWFLLNTNGIENLSNVTRFELSLYKPKAGLYSDNIKTLIFDQNQDITKIYKSIFCQKLDKIEVKEDKFDVYNVVIQFEIYMFENTNHENGLILTNTLGNMNSIGL